MSIKGKAVVLLQHWPDGSKHVVVRVRTWGGWWRFEDDWERILEWLEGADTWHREFDRLKAGQWVRYYVKYSQSWFKCHDHYYGGFEWTDTFDVEIVRTLKRGALHECYVEKRFQHLLGRSA